MFRIDYKSGLPIFEQIYPNTVQRAYAMLEHDGVIASVPGKGSFLTQPQTVLEKRRAAALAQVRQAVAEAVDCGVSRETLLAVFQDPALEKPEKEE